MNDTESESWPTHALPWATFAATAAALGIFFSATAVHLLQFERSQVAAGEWWRVFTANWVHFSGTELLWNLAVLVPAGIWAERIAPLRSRVLFVAAPLVIGALVFFVLPDVRRFAGLSGLAAGMAAFLAVAQLRRGEGDRWFWQLVLGLLALKVAVEVVLATPWIVAMPDPAARAAALIHLAGIATGVFVLGARRRRGADGR